VEAVHGTLVLWMMSLAKKVFHTYGVIKTWEHTHMDVFTQNRNTTR
jgi:hypothetical protein